MRYPAHMRLTIDFEWDTLGPISAPSGTLVMPEVPAGAGVYRFSVQTVEGIEVYVGESTSARRRMRNYAGTYSGATADRVRAILLDHIERGNRITLETATGIAFQADGTSVDVDLRRKHIRLLIESAAIDEALRAGYRVHNLDRGVVLEP